MTKDIKRKFKDEAEHVASVSDFDRESLAIGYIAGALHSSVVKQMEQALVNAKEFAEWNEFNGSPTYKNVCKALQDLQTLRGER